MKKTKFLTCLAALTLLLAGCEVAAENLDSDTTGTESSDTTTSDTGTSGDTGDTGEGGDTGTGGDGSGGGEGGDTQETPVTYTYSVEVTNADALKELTYDGNADSQTGVDLTINLVTTSSTGDVTTDTASADDVTLTPASDGVITVSGLTVTPVAAGDTTLTITWTEGNVSTNADVTVTDVTVSTPEPTPTEPTSWSEYLEANADGNHIDYKATIDAFLDGDLDEIVPYVASEIGYQYILVYEAEGRVAFKVSDSDSGPATNAAAAWKTAITDFGYTDLGGSTYQNEAGYKVEFVDWSFIGDFTVYVYPIEQVQEGPTTWSEYLAANAGSTSIDSEDAITALLGASLDEILPYVVPECGYNFITVDTTTGCVSFTLDNATYAASTLAEWKTALVAFGYEEISSLTYQNEAGYKVTLTDWTFIDMIYVYVYPPVAESEGPSSWADYFTDEYTQGVLNELFDGVALDDILPFYLEESGLTRCEPQPTLLRFNIEYYPEPSGLTETWVALLLEDGWTETGDESSNQGTTETISFEKDGYTISIVIEWGYWDLYLYPRTTTGGGEDDEDLKTAQAILDVVTQTSYLDWDAFHGESVDDWEETISEYLTTDEDGNAYGYIVSSEDSNTYYYYGGYKCVYNQAGAAQTPGVSYLDFENELDDYSSPLLSAHSLNLSNVDSYEINELSDGYELVITNGASSNVYGYGTEYVYTVDSEFNLIALGQYGPENVASSDLVGSYAEKITYADVEEALEATSFNPDDFGLGGGDDEEPSGLTLADYIAALSEKEFNYGDGFYFCQQSVDMSSGLDYDSLEIEALSNDVGYASQGHYDADTGYYASEFYSDGTTTYMYDTDDQEVADAGGLYGYWFYQYTLESYFDLDTITEQLNSLGEDADLTDTDNAITDSYLYLFAASADETISVTLFAAYDESGITYLGYTYGTLTSSYLVEFYPTDTVTTPEWYVPTTGSNAIADLFNAALEEKNYTIVLEITDYQSNETSYAPNGFSPYVQLEPLQDLWCKITYTTDAAVVEYYGSYDELLAGTVMDVEYYLNTDSGLDVFMIFDWYDVDTVYYQWTEDGLTWQDYLGSLFGLEDYFSNFVEGETTTTERGTEVSYTLDNLDSDFLEALINALVDNGNYWAWETHGVEQILSEGTDVSYTVTYLEDSGIIEFVFVSDEYTYYDEEHFCYYLEQTTIKVYVLDAGSSSTPSYTLEYNTGN